MKLKLISLKEYRTSTYSCDILITFLVFLTEFNAHGVPAVVKAQSANICKEI